MEEELKYKISNEPEDTIEFEGHTLHRIIAITPFLAGDDYREIRSGDKGGFVEQATNLSQKGICWICDEAKVFGNSTVKSSAVVFGHSVIKNDSVIAGHALIGTNAVISGSSITGRVSIGGNASVSGKCDISGHMLINGDVTIDGHVIIHAAHLSLIRDFAHISGKVKIRVRTINVVGNTQILSPDDFLLLTRDGEIKDVTITSPNDYFSIQNQWSSENLITYTRPNRKWHTGCFYGTGRELISKAYCDDYNKGECFRQLVPFVEKLCKTRSNTPKAPHNPFKLLMWQLRKSYWRMRQKQ